MMPRALTDVEEAEVCTRYRAGASTHALARRFEVGQRTIVRILERHHVPRRPGSPRRADVDDATIVRLRDDGLSWAQVGRAVRLSPSGVRVRYAAATSGVSAPNGHRMS